MCESYNLQYGTNFISVMPTNLYGKNDNYDLEKSHVLPALIRRMHLGKCLVENNWEALRRDLDKNPVESVSGKNTEKEILDILNKYGIFSEANNVVIKLWGTGKPLREFLYVDDLANACVYLLENIDFDDVRGSSDEVRNTHINIGTGKDLPIKELAEMVKNIVGFTGDIIWDTAKPDGTYKKQLDVSKLNNLGWKEKVSLEEGVKLVYKNYIK